MDLYMAERWQCWCVNTISRWVFIGAFSELSHDARSLRASIRRARHARIVTQAVFIPLELQSARLIASRNGSRGRSRFRAYIRYLGSE